MLGPRTPGLSLRQEQVQRLELKVEEKSAVNRGAEFWATKPHYHTEIPVSALRSLLTQREAPADAGAVVRDEGKLEEDFVKLTPAEMAELMPGEKVGILLGEGIFIADDVPEEYVPFVLLNLAANRRLHDDARVLELFRSVGADTGTARHWSSNLVDVLAAERFYRDDRAGFIKYLEYRKGVERTTFFDNELLRPHFDAALLQLAYRRTTHPADRGRRVSASWALAGVAVSDSRMERLFLDLGVSKTDLLYRRLQQEGTFDPEVMMQLLNFIETNARRETVGKSTAHHGKQRDVITLEGNPGLGRQAYLLTEDVTSSAALFEKIPGSGYVLKSYWRLTCRALKDRIAYFARESMTRRLPDVRVGAALLRLLKSAGTIQLGGLAASTLEIDLNSPEQREQAQRWLTDQIAAIDRELEKVGALLGRYTDLEMQMGNSGTGDVHVVPGTIEEGKRELLEHQRALIVKRGELESTVDFLRLTAEVRAQHRALLEATVLDESPSRGRLPDGQEPE